MIFSEGVLNAGGNGVGNALVEQGLLAFQKELLVAQRTDGQPSQNEARHKDSEDKNERDFLHETVL